jgi:erythronate-4-phosphate dehydrogenase
MSVFRQYCAKHYMRILIDHNIPALAEALQASGIEVRTAHGRDITNTDVADCTALFVRSITHVSPALLEGSAIRFVATATSGTDHIDTAYLSERGIAFSDAKGCNAEAVAEYVLHGIVLYAERAPCNVQTLRIGVIGYGECGRRVVRLLHILGVQEIRVCDPYVQAQNIALPGHAMWVNIDTIFRTCQIITNHIPLTQETQGMIGHSALGLLPKGALIIHASRGGIIDEDALVQAVYHNQCFAVVDVWQNEPMINRALVQASLLATPHIAGYTQEGKLRGSIIVLYNFIQWAQQSSLLRTDSIIRLHDSYETMKHSPLFQDKRLLHTGYSTHDLLHTLHDARPFAEDDSIMRSTSNISESETRRVFDARRKQYPKSRELFVDE